MRTYTITIQVRTGPRTKEFHKIEIRATNPLDAAELALGEAILTWGDRCEVVRTR